LRHPATGRGRHPLARLRDAPLSAIRARAAGNDRPIEAQRVTAARRRTLEERRLRSHFKAQLREVRGKRHAETAFVRAWTNQRLAPEIASLKARHDAECANLNRQQGTLTAIFMAAIDFTSQTRRNRAAAWQALAARHRRERAELAAEIRQTRAVQAEAVWVRYEPEIEAIKLSRRHQVAGMKERHHDEMLREDAALQLREAERDQARNILKQQIDAWKKAQRETPSRHAAAASPIATDWNAKDEPPRQPSPEQNPTDLTKPPHNEGPS
jgi:hypothetical protein